MEVYVWRVGCRPNSSNMEIFETLRWHKWLTYKMSSQFSILLIFMKRNQLKTVTLITDFRTRMGNSRRKGKTLEADAQILLYFRIYRSFSPTYFCKSWRIYLAIVFSSCHFHTWKNSAGNGEITQRHPNIENLVYDKKKHDHTSAEYRTKNVSIKMIIMKASKVIIIRLSYAIFWAKMGPK